MKEEKTVWHDVFHAFSCQGEVDSISKYGSGHINDTFLVKTKSPNHPDYTFRCVNTYVFKNIDGLMQNIALVIDHIQHKIKSCDEYASMQALQLIRTLDNQLYYKDAMGHVWTCYIFVPGQTHEEYHNLKLPEQAGRAFGQFACLLQDLDPTKLCESIPDFHDIHLRLAQWEKAKATADAKVLDEAQIWIDFVESRLDSMKTLPLLKSNGGLPLRITHNDTKCNNVLFNDKDEAICVIDLDTVMPGVIAYDFSDAIRTATTSHQEDEKDIEKVQFNRQAFDVFTKNYIKHISSFATKEEILSLANTVTYISFLLGLRFLIDHVAGDVYFKTKYRGHNLIRARNQFRFVEILEDNQAWIDQVVQYYGQTSEKVL
jgi:Ser/Thr protein kinase RdoA (MazF antagonist)